LPFKHKHRLHNSVALSLIMYQQCYLSFKDIAHMQNHDVFWCSSQAEYRHQTLGHISETYSAAHLAYNTHILVL